MSSSNMCQPGEREIKHPAPALQDVEPRLQIASQLEREIQSVHDGFSFRVEQHVMILLAEPQQFEIGGTLSEEMSPTTLKRRLTRGSPFAKHYMLHSNPANLVEFKDVWEHAFYRAPIPQPPLTIKRCHKADWDLIRQSMYYNQRFRTSPELESALQAKDEEAKCRQRDKNACQLLPEGTLNTTIPMVFWLIPRGWNDTVDNNNATGNLLLSGKTLTNVDLLDDIISPHELGKTHKAWNMVCVHADLFQALSRGWCALKYEETELRNDGKVNVVCRFYWMPQLTGRFNKPAAGASEVYSLLEELNLFFEAACPTPPIYPSGSPAPDSGILVKLEREKADVQKTISAIKVHWGCILYTALCGGVGRAQFLTGMDQSDGSLKPRDEEFMAVRTILEKNDGVSDMTWKHPAGS